MKRFRIGQRLRARDVQDIYNRGRSNTPAVDVAEAYPDGSVPTRARALKHIPRDYSSFRKVSFTGGTTITIGAGHFVLPGIGAYEASEATVNLTGATAYCYVRHTKDHATTEIMTTPLADYPQSTGSEYRKALWKLTSDDGGSTYTIDRDCRHDVMVGGGL